MERRTFIIGMGSILMGACASKPRLQAGSNPYAAGTPTAVAVTGPGMPPPPPASRQPMRVVRTEQGDAVRCAPGGVHYTTRRGDTLQGIATRYQIPATSICRANPGRISATRVTPGRMIWLPGARPIACEPVVAERRAIPSPCEAPVRSRPEPRRGGYRLVRRADWGAESLKPNHDPMNGVRRITLHHTDEVPGIRARGDREIVSAIQRYHRNELGWADIGYHYLIGRDGLVYEGRTATAQGAHSGGANNIQNLGIALVGNFSRRMPTHGQMSALEAFLGDQQRMHRVGTRQVFGHRDLGPTECPGTTLYGWLQQYKTYA
ncbi:MAG: N-acetylmuramoyl-L-alanine amidase [Planctomycetota bacterium]|nr:N-acetylmuramoyl-L-alanine amidase [Planctomycetota bacterium]